MISKWSSGPSFLKDKACSQLDSSRSLKTVLYVSSPLLHLFQTCNVSAGIFLPLFMASDDGDDVCLCVGAQSLSCARLFLIPWTLAHKSPLSMEFPSKNVGAG